MSQFRTAFAVTVGPDAHVRRKVVESIRDIITTNRLTLGEASKLRGSIQWMESAMMGKPCRAQCSALIARQYHDDAKGTRELTPYLADALRILAIAAEHMPCRDIFVRAPPE